MVRQWAPLTSPAPSSAIRIARIGSDVAVVEEVDRQLAPGVAPVDVSVRSDSHAVKLRDLFERMILTDRHSARADCAHPMLTSSRNTQ
jgi:hypothetical protein